jgi:hypothetical protein
MLEAVVLFPFEVVMQEVCGKKITGPSNLLKWESGSVLFVEQKQFDTSRTVDQNRSCDLSQKRPTIVIPAPTFLKVRVEPEDAPSFASSAARKAVCVAFSQVFGTERCKT